MANTESPAIKIREDKRNYRKHSARNLELINKSFADNGAGRSIVADNTGTIIGGNGAFITAQKRGIPIRTIETNGDELICVLRKDLAPDDPRRAALAIMDNSTSDSSEFDLELLQQDFDIPFLQDLGVDIADEEMDDKIPDEVGIEETYEVVIECSDESEQQEIFERLTNEGMKCRLLTL